MALRRGDLVTVALPGDDGKPRPALIVQDDAFSGLDSVTLTRAPSDLREGPSVRIPMSPNLENGLRLASHIMVDKAATVPLARLGERIGCVDAVTMEAVDVALARFLGLASPRR